jgi:protease IV
MKRAVLGTILGAIALTACAPQIRIDLLGEDKLREVVLSPGPARDKVLMIDIDGTISAALETGFLSREKSVVARVYERLERAAADPRIKAVLLRLDTPGGEVTASDMIYHEVRRFKERTGKPVVGLMMGVAASGGYYIAAACDAIIAHPSTLTGSIGVISVFPSVEGLMSKVGVKVEIVKSGPAKDAGSPFRAMTETEKALYQGIIDEFYEGFLAVVARGRKGRIAEAELRTIADGRVYTAPQALKLGLIDGVGYFEDAFGKARDLAGIERARLVSYTYFPGTKSNIYAGRPGDALFDLKALEALAGSLKTGFYYLWLPQTP